MQPDPVTVDIAWWIPPLVSFVVAFFSSTGGLSGAFILMPVQVSLFGFVTPGVTPTNHLYNLIAIPSGVYRYVREGRMLWPLAILLALGFIPGIVLGSWIRVKYLPDPKAFKLFVGCVLAFISGRMLYQNLLTPLLVRLGAWKKKEEEKLEVTTLEIREFTLKRLTFHFSGRDYSYPTPGLFFPAVLVGVIAGIYGVGGGAIYIALLVTLFPMPVYAFSGALLFGTFLSSIIGVLSFTVLAPLYGDAGMAINPDWRLGGLLGLGGVFGMYLGARFQKKVPQATIKSIIGSAMMVVAVRYIIGYFL